MHSQAAASGSFSFPVLIAGSANTPTNFEFSQNALQCGVLVNLISECMDNRAFIGMDERWRREDILLLVMWREPRIY
jgi:hypothetical protein